jgi:hypothetical protein
MSDQPFWLTCQSLISSTPMSDSGGVAEQWITMKSVRRLMSAPLVRFLTSCHTMATILRSISSFQVRLGVCTTFRQGLFVTCVTRITFLQSECFPCCVPGSSILSLLRLSLVCTPVPLDLAGCPVRCLGSCLAAFCHSILPVLLSILAYHVASVGFVPRSAATVG